MESHHSMGCGDTGKTDHGPKPFAANIMREARQNKISVLRFGQDAVFR